MERKYLKEFELVRTALKTNRYATTPKQLYKELLGWGRKLLESKEISDIALFEQNLAYFDRLDIDEYMFEATWYNLQDMIEYDILRPEILKVNRAVDLVAKVLWEVIAFKTNRDCELLRDDNLRLLTNEDKSKLFLHCDRCFLH